MNIFEALTSNDSFAAAQVAQLLVTVAPSLANESAADPETPLPPSPEVEHTAEDIHGAPGIPVAEELPEPLPTMEAAPPPDCQACSAHYLGWCGAVRPESWVNVKFIEPYGGCPRGQISLQQSCQNQEHEEDQCKTST
jgi:hypothetical protein